MKYKNHIVTARSIVAVKHKGVSGYAIEGEHGCGKSHIAAIISALAVKRYVASPIIIDDISVEYHQAVKALLKLASPERPLILVAQDFTSITKLIKKQMDKGDCLLLCGTSASIKKTKKIANMYGIDTGTISALRIRDFLAIWKVN